MSNALDIANHVLIRCDSKGRKISNLQLQKVLYFVWCDYYKATHSHLFEDNFIAWKLGPVVLDAYRKYCVFGYLDIFYPDNRFPQDTVDFNVASVIDPFIDAYSSMSAFDLVNKSHESGSPWDTVFDNGRGHNDIIPFSLIESYLSR